MLSKLRTLLSSQSHLLLRPWVKHLQMWSQMLLWSFNREKIDYTDLKTSWRWCIWAQALEVSLVAFLLDSWPSTIIPNGAFSTTPSLVWLSPYSHAGWPKRVSETKLSMIRTQEKTSQPVRRTTSLHTAVKGSWLVPKLKVWIWDKFQREMGSVSTFGRTAKQSVELWLCARSTSWWSSLWWKVFYHQALKNSLTSSWWTSSTFPSSPSRCWCCLARSAMSSEPSYTRLGAGTLTRGGWSSSPCASEFLPPSSSSVLPWDGI